ncbi:hypothetical protein HPB47_002391, partial [Ixodes persulcatus]
MEDTPLPARQRHSMEPHRQNEDEKQRHRNPTHQDASGYLQSSTKLRTTPTESQKPRQRMKFFNNCGKALLLDQTILHTMYSGTFPIKLLETSSNISTKPGARGHFLRNRRKLRLPSSPSR